jgi:CheY-like chemotaxis protein/anti-sigma regulatory factor (Ser/Thr protein kinase)
MMPTVLVVDDSATDRLLAGGLLSQNGDFEVEYAIDGSDAILKIELHVPDLVVTDMDMPELNGLELVAVIREAYPLVPVILMTALGSEELALKALRAGAASYVPKRQLATELLETVHQVYQAAKEDRGRIRLMRRMSEQQVQFTIENDHELIASLVQYLKDAAAGMGICNDGERVRTGVALQEALTNACLHGNLELSSALREDDHQKYYDFAKERMLQMPFSQRRIHVTARYSLDTAEFCIRDEGPGFNRDELPDPTDPTNLERPCGRGLLLMQTFMDEVNYNQAGNEVTMIKRRRNSEAVRNQESE